MGKARGRPEYLGDPRMEKKCWCGAKKGRTCMDKNGVPTGTHRTRGMSKKAVQTMAKMAGLEGPR